MFDAFLSYNWRDHDQVEALAQRLRSAGVNVFLDRWYLAPGTNWLKALEATLDSSKAVVVCIGAEMGPWQLREQYSALERQADEERRGKVFPVIPVLLPGSEPPLGFLRQNTWVDLRSRMDDSEGVRLLAKAVRGEPPGPDAQSVIQATLARVCPYRGLLYFREEDAEFFFGREDPIRQLQAAVDMHSLVALVGASGCGKSSVVRAGLIPALRKSKARVWEIATIVPGDRPLHALASTLVPMLEPQMSEVERLGQINLLAQQFAAGAIGLRDVADRVCAKQPGTDRLMLVCDQWEELFTLTSDQAVRRRFIDTILEGTEKANVSVVLTLRGDFFDRAIASYRLLSDRLQGAQVNLGPMNESELRQAIEEPAARVGLNFEAGLVDTVLADAGDDEPGNLPLLEFVLRQLWEERQAGHMHRAAYLAMGQLRGAIAQRADTVYGAVTDRERVVLRRIFTRLVHPGEGEHDTRRRATADEFGSPALPLIKKLSDERLLVTSRIGETETVEVSHEALIRNWRLLRGWVDEERQFITWQQDLHETAAKWDSNKRTADLLLRGASLQRAREWQSKQPEALSELEAGLIAASVRRKHVRTSMYIFVPALVVLSFLGVLSSEIDKALGGIASGLANIGLHSEEDADVRVADSYDTIARDKEQAGRLGEARKFYEEGTNIRERVALAHPLNSGVQRGLSQSYVNLGNVCLAMDQLDEARKYYKQNHDLCDREAKAHPKKGSPYEKWMKSLARWDYEEWQEHLSESYVKLGDLGLAARQFDVARDNYTLARNIINDLAKGDPTTGGAQPVHLLGIYNKLGDVELAAGRLDAARKHYEQFFEIAKGLAKDDRSTLFQLDLSESYMKLGDAQLAVRQFDVARDNYTLAQRTIRFELKPHALWFLVSQERHLRIIYNRMGDLEIAMGRLDAAGKEYGRGLDIAKRTAGRSPRDAIAQRDLSESYMKVGDVLVKQSQGAKALANFRIALAIRTSLADSDPTNALWKRGVSELQTLISEVEARRLP
jgi:tetratricopeptide (TPR) repeat protein